MSSSSSCFLCPKQSDTGDRVQKNGTGPGPGPATTGYWRQRMRTRDRDRGFCGGAVPHERFGGRVQAKQNFKYTSAMWRLTEPAKGNQLK